MTKAELPQTSQTQLPEYLGEELRSSVCLRRVTDGAGTVAVRSSTETAIAMRLPQDVIRAQGKMALGPLELI